MKIAGMKWLPIQVGGVDSPHKFYVAPDLCAELILGEDWLTGYRAQLSFNPAALVVGGKRVSLGGDSSNPLPVVLDEDVKLPP